MVFIIKFSVTTMYLSKFNEDLLFLSIFKESRGGVLKCETLDIIQMTD